MLLLWLLAVLKVVVVVVMVVVVVVVVVVGRDPARKFTTSPFPCSSLSGPMPSATRPEAESASELKGGSRFEGKLQ